MKQSDSIDLLAVALVAAQSALKPVAKGGSATITSKTGASFGYDYATLPDIQRAVLPVLAANGLFLSQGTVDEDVSGFTVETTLIHVSGQWMTTRIRVPLASETAQAAGSGFSYGKRIGMVGALCVITDDPDDDGEAATAPGKGKSEPKQNTINPAPQKRPATATPQGEPSCPVCKGAMWDNRFDKKNPRAPDFKCRDKSCDGAIWPPKNPPASGQEHPPIDLYEEEFAESGR